MSSKKITTSVGLSQEVMDQIKEEATRELRSASYIVERALRRHYGLAVEIPKENHVEA